MTYYRIKDKYDNCCIHDKKGNFIDFVIGRELYTEKEFNKKHFPLYIADKIELSKSKVYFNFGCRFSQLENTLAYDEMHIGA